MSNPVYFCRFCKNPIEATELDIATARADQADNMRCDGDLVAAETDAELMDRFGRDICPACTGEKGL